jgi:hypothetical protein
MPRQPRFKLHLAKNFDKSLLPVPATRLKSWWDDNSKTKNHALHCLPLTMANSLGYYILSPGTFLVKWNGDTQSDVEIEHIEKSSHYVVDSHAAFGSFTVQANFIPVTERPGEFVYVKGIPNERAPAFTCMEAVIEAWWQVGNFGLVFLMTRPGEILIKKGEPIAQFFVYYGQAGSAEFDVVDDYPPEHYGWLQRRSRLDYRKDLDYLKGCKYSGEKVPNHLIHWKNASIYEHASGLDQSLLPAPSDDHGHNGEHQSQASS